MSQTRIRRGGAARLTTGARASRPRASAGGKSSLDRLVARLPVSHALLQRGVTWAIVLVVLAAVLGVASFFGLPGMARMELAELVARAGYEVKKVEVHGTRRMDEMTVYSIALGQVDRSMLNVDLEAVRQQILALPYVGDARVSRRLPDTLIVDIVERQPAAVWQHLGRLALIDAEGKVLQPVVLGAVPNLPLLVGEDANFQATRFARLMEAAPALKALVSGATWVGDRRWDIRFQSGETLALPEGDEAAAAALVEFARLEGINRLLGRGIVRFDMRDPDKFVLRMPKDRTAPAIVGASATLPEGPPPASQEARPAAERQTLSDGEQG